MLLLKNSQYFQKNVCFRVSLFNKVAGLKACNLIKKRLQHRRFLINIAKFLRTPLWKTSMNGCFWRSILLINPITHVVNYSARGLRGINIGIMIYKFVMSPFVYQILQGYVKQPFTNFPNKLNIHPLHLSQWQLKANNLNKWFCLFQTFST